MIFQLSPIETLFIGVVGLICLFAGVGTVFYFGFLGRTGGHIHSIEPISNLYWLCIPFFIMAFIFFELLLKYGYKKETTPE